MTVKVYRMDFFVMFQTKPAGCGYFLIIGSHCANDFESGKLKNNVSRTI